MGYYVTFELHNGLKLGAQVMCGFLQERKKPPNNVTFQDLQDTEIHVKKISKHKFIFHVKKIFRPIVQDISFC